MVSQGAQPSQAEFFGNAPEGRKYRLLEIIGKGSYGLVASAIDLQTQQRVAIKKIINVFDHVSDSTRILREIKLLRLLKHPGVLYDSLCLQYQKHC
jgi:serine/threonine protein kinase